MDSDEYDCTNARLCRRRMGMERKVPHTTANSADVSSSIDILGCPRTTSNTVLRA